MSKYPRLKKWTPVIVQWDDASTVYEESHSDNKIADPGYRSSIGFVIESNRKHIRIAMEDDRNFHITETDCQTVTRIPRGMVKQIIVLRSIDNTT